MNTLIPRLRVQLLPRPLLLLVTLLCLLSALFHPPQPFADPQPASHIATSAASATNLANVALSFVPNAGQTDPNVRFEARALGGTLFFTPAAIVLTLPNHRREQPQDHHLLLRTEPQPVTDADSPATVRVRFDGANPSPTIIGVDPLPGVVNYFLGNDPAHWRANVPTSAGVIYQQLYPGIDLRYDGTDGHLKGTYLVSLGANPALIRWRYEGASSVRVDDATGDLHITLDAAGNHTMQTTLIEHAPIAWQTIQGQHKAVAARYVLAEDGSISFKLGQYDVTQPLTLDPTLEYSSYLGGSDADVGHGIAVDSIGNAYVTGTTGSINFPTTNVFQPTNQGQRDAFVTKLSASGALLFSTYLGGSGTDTGNSIAVDSTGNAYITGTTTSPNFPTANAPQPTLQGDIDAFVTKLSASGALLFSTYLGGSGTDTGNSITVDSTGNAYITGYTTSPNFPTANALQPTLQGGNDAFVTKLSASGALFFSTYLGGSGTDTGNSIAVDSTGNAYITGYTTSPNFPTANALQPSLQGDIDAFVTKLSASGALFFSTYLGGNDHDYGNGIAADSAGNTYITGRTTSTNFPTANAFQPILQVEDDAFVTKLSASGTLLFSTYLGGNWVDSGTGITVDSAGNAYVTGWTESTNFPTANALQPTYQGSDAFVTKLSAGGTLLFSTYLGGRGPDYSFGIAVDSIGNAYVTGWTESSTFPTASALQPTFQGSSDAFVAKIATGARLFLNATVTPPSVPYCPIAPCQMLTYRFELTATDGIVPTTLTATLPKGLIYLSGGDYDPGTHQIHFDSTIEPNVPAIFTFRARLMPGLASGAILTTGVVASGSGQTLQRSLPVAVQESTFAGTLVLLYGSGDNNLSGEMLKLAAKAEQGAANANVAALLLLDGPREDDTYLYRLQPATPDQNCPDRYTDYTCGGRYQDGQTVWHWNTDSLGDPTTLTAFLVAAERAYPNARHIVLSLIGHGGGWSPSVPAGQPSGHKVQPGGDPLGGMLWDDHPGNTISTPALGQALRDSVTATGRRIDLLFLDACDMAMVEVAYELRDSADYLLASPNWKWAAFPYDHHLSSISGNLGVDAIARAWFRNEKDAVSEWGEPYTYTLIKLRAAGGAAEQPLDRVRAAVDALGHALMTQTTGTGRARILAAFAAADRYDSNQDGAIAPLPDTQADPTLAWDNYVDLLSFATQLQTQFRDTPAVTDAAQQVIQMIGEAVVDHKKVSGIPSNFPDRVWSWRSAGERSDGGLSIYLPLQPDDWRRRYYGRLAFTRDSPHWIGFLNTWWNNSAIPGEPTCPTGGCSLPPPLLPRVRLYIPIVHP